MMFTLDLRTRGAKESPKTGEQCTANACNASVSDASAPARSERRDFGVGARVYLLSVFVGSYHILICYCLISV